MKNKKCGLNNIPVSIIKEIAPIISDTLSEIFNICAVNGVYPDILKLGRVTPIYKKGSHEDCSNYRPITILPIFNKIFEKLINKRMVSFINTFSILSENQYGYLKNKSTNHALLHLINHILNAFSLKKYLVAVFLDLSKAFDTVDHKILLDKMYRYGFRGPFLDLISSYLTNRRQYVDIDGNVSQTLPVTKGVPQGFVLGPLLFLIFINDINFIMTSLRKVLFADDTVLYATFDSLTHVGAIMNHYLDILHEWLLANKLKLNINKTNFLIFTMNINYNIPDLRINNISIDHVSKITYLGVILDNKLSFNDHINLLCTKLARINGLIYSLKHLLPFHCLKTIYFSFTYSYLNNNIIIWGGCPKTVLKPLQIMQNKTVRNLAPNNALNLHTDEMYKTLNLLNINQLYLYRSSEFGFKWLFCNEYNMLHNERQNVHFIHGHNTRSNNRLRAPFPRLEKHKQFVVYNFIKIFNLLPVDIPDANINIFKKYCYNYIKDNIQ